VTASTARAVECGLLSARGFDRVVRIGWSLADLAGRTSPSASDLDVALGLRGLQTAA
jgi:magnesium chelatase family protein